MWSMRCAVLLRAGLVAEHPQLLGGAVIPVDHGVDLERVELPGPESTNRLLDVADQLTQLRLVIGGDLLTGGPPLRLRSHPVTVPTRVCAPNARRGVFASIRDVPSSWPDANRVG